MSANVWKGAVIGAGCGVLATFAMNAVPMVWDKFEKKQAPGQPPESAGKQESEDATVKAAKQVAEPVLQRPLTADEEKVGGPLVHFGVGTALGAVYGALGQVSPAIRLGFGTAYGTGAWIMGDEVAVPAMGLAPWPIRTPVKDQLKFWLMHVVYGLALDGSRRLVESHV